MSNLIEGIQEIKKNILEAKVKDTEINDKVKKEMMVIVNDLRKKVDEVIAKIMKAGDLKRPEVKEIKGKIMKVNIDGQELATFASAFRYSFTGLRNGYIDPILKIRITHLPDLGEFVEKEVDKALGLKHDSNSSYENIRTKIASFGKYSVSRIVSISGRDKARMSITVQVNFPAIK